ncbi:ABC transporter ATP-binding protein [Chelatococcus reniformis]|uniref:ABC transporter ATP-binding protein n=1 Tax=Chelatococcus reniformis TaxID=1494448 RepID=A0A916TX56_9HYPH|nr:ABC transporter ATP-binding protein [Chelatococcus reniformis]GGC49548.1 ABC transporter ATP-binding protein [Chelatococcus reniformis]
MGLILDRVRRDVGAETYIHETSLRLAPGTMTVLLGPTLAGKTSLMRLMAGLDRPTAGRILTTDGRSETDVTGVAVRERSVAMVYQQFINYPNLSVFENIASPLRVKRLPKAEIDDKVRAMARLMQLEPFLERPPLSLSGGQQQRTAMARALIRGADLVLLDEPLANLDYKLREELREELPKIVRASRATVVYATTEPQEALLLGDYTAALWQGRVTQYGPSAEVYRRPTDLTTAQIFSDPPLNLLPVSKREAVIQLPGGASIPAGGALAALADGDYRLGFRAHQLALRAGPAPSLAFAGTVTVAEITGSESYVHVECAGLRWVALVPGVQELEPGAAITVHVDPAHVFVFASDDRLAHAPAVRTAA